MLVAALVAGLQIDFVNLLITVIHERAFKTSTTHPFACLIFKLFIEARLPIWHCDILRHPAGIVDIGFIKNESNVVAPWRRPRLRYTY